MLRRNIRKNLFSKNFWANHVNEEDNRMFLMIHQMSYGHLNKSTTADGCRAFVCFGAIGYKLVQPEGVFTKFSCLVAPLRSVLTDTNRGWFSHLWQTHTAPCPRKRRISFCAGRDWRRGR